MVHKIPRWIFIVGVWFIVFLLLAIGMAACSKITGGEAGNNKVTYNPPRPQDAPADIRESGLLGQNILSDTQKVLATYVGNNVKCTNCHFNQGLTQGGKNGGISLVGVAAVYPKVQEQQKSAVDLITQVNNCMQRSENGKALPAGSKEMTAIVNYLQWISKGIPRNANIPWLGVEKIQNYQPGNPDAGSGIFSTQCTVCHGVNGQGLGTYPPLWGQNSYNDGAGMANAETLTGFVHQNMPYGSPDLSVQEAEDVAAFVDSQPRPHFQP